ncbi:MAG: stage III sporulation protein AF [Clostridia bacterium]|nr:stage III sporulation protein AF [Clostridia bacterium]
MIEFLKSWVFNIVTLTLFIVLLEIMIPTGKLKKIINLVSGFILIIALVNPLLAFLNKGADIRDFQIADGYYLDKKELDASTRLMEEKRMRQVAEVYRKKLIRRLEDGLAGTENISSVEADVMINEDYKSESFGDIKRVYLKISLNGKAQSIQPVTRVEKIKIGDGEKNAARSGKVTEQADEALKKRIEDKVNKILDIKHENIIIAIVEK